LQIADLKSEIRNPKSEIDLLLLDIHMPELDGFQVIRLIREREQATGGHLPVIALTARSRKEDREQCLAAGMDDFLAKPVRAAELQAAIERLMANAPSSDRPEPGLVDPHVLLAACGGDAVILNSICQAFQARLPEQLSAVHDALHDEDPPRLREAAHKLHGMIAAFSTTAGAVISQLEDEAAAGRLTACQPLAEQLAAIARQLLQQVDGVSIETLRHLAAASGSAQP
jgi:two-component system sensor histidine kinase/response regulator